MRNRAGGDMCINREIEHEQEDLFLYESDMISLDLSNTLKDNLVKRGWNLKGIKCLIDSLRAKVFDNLKDEIEAREK
jgi:hypothetical protein